MKSTKYLVGVMALLILASSGCLAKSWRGLVPLITTRAQVLDALGSPKLKTADQTESFDLTNEVVVLRWIRPTCGTQTPVPKGEPFQRTDLVLQITVNPKVPLKTKPVDFETNPNGNRDRLTANVNCIGHSDGKWSSCSIMSDGFGYSTSEAGITALYYYPSASETKEWNATRESCSSSGAT